MSGKPISSFTFNVHNVQLHVYNVHNIYNVYNVHNVQCTMYNVQLQLNFRVPMSFSPSPNVQTTFSQRIWSSHCDIFTSAALHPSPFWPLTRCPLWEWDWIEWFLWRMTNWHQFTYFAHGLIRFQPQTDRAPTSHGIIQPLPPSSSIDLNTWQKIVYIPYHTYHIFKYSIHLRWCDIFCQLMFQQSKGAEGVKGEGVNVLEEKVSENVCLSLTKELKEKLFPMIIGTFSISDMIICVCRLQNLLPQPAFPSSLPPAPPSPWEKLSNKKSGQVSSFNKLGGGGCRRVLEGGLVKYQTFVLFEPSFFKEKRLYAYKHIGQKILQFHNQSSEIFAEYKFQRIPLSLPATWPRQHLQHILHQLGNGGWNTDDWWQTKVGFVMC